MKKMKGFTILELMIVCVIIAILATIIFVNLDRGKMRARDAQRKADLTRIAGALENYKADNKVYISSGALVGGLPPFIDANGSPISSLVTNNYINSLPTDPKTSTVYYRYASDGGQYKLVAKSETITTVPDSGAQGKAGDFYNVVEIKCFQISSSNTALAYTAGAYCTN